MAATKKAKVKKATSKVPKEKKEKVPGVGDVAIQAIRDGKDNEETLALVQKKFPEAQVSKASIAWYRNKLRSDGEKIPTARDIKKGRKKEAA